MIARNTTVILMAVLLVLVGYIISGYNPAAEVKKNHHIELAGENKINDIRVIRNDGRRLVVEVDYFYNGKRINGKPEIHPNICLTVHTKSNVAEKKNAKYRCTGDRMSAGDHTVLLGVNNLNFNYDTTRFTTHVTVVMGRFNTIGSKHDLTSNVIEKEIPLHVTWLPYLYYMPDGVNSENIAELISKAESFIDSNDRNSLNHAKVMLDQIILFDPKYVDAYPLLARYQIKANKSLGVDQAVRILLSTLELDKNHVDSMLLLSGVYVSRENYREAEKYLKRVEEIGTNNLWLYATWGELLKRQKKYNEAIKLFEKVIRVTRPYDRNDQAIKQSYKQLLYIYIARNDAGDDKKTDYLFRGRMDYFPEEACYPLHYANYKLTQRGEASEAIALAEKSLSMNCKLKDYNNKVLSASYLGKYYSMSDKDRLVNKQLVNKAVSIYSYTAYLINYLAEYKKTSKYIQFLFYNGIDINVKDSKGNTALFLAVKNNKIQAVSNLIKENADVNLATNNGKITPLMMAVAISNIDLVRLLLKSGADRSIQDKNRLTASDWANRLGNKDIIKLLSSATGV